MVMGKGCKICGYLYERISLFTGGDSEGTKLSGWMADSLNGKWYVLVVFERNWCLNYVKMGKLMLFRKDGKGWCFNNGENGENLVFQQWRKWGKVGVSATEKLVFQQRERKMLLLKKNRKMLLKGSMREWIMNWSGMAMFPKMKPDLACNAIVPSASLRI